MFSENYVMQPSTYDKTVTKGRGKDKKTETIAKPWNMNSHTCQSIADDLRRSGKEIITQRDYERALLCVGALKGNELIKASIEVAQKQVSIVWNEPNTGVLCKARLDMLGSTIDDLKTAQDASQSEFAYAIGKYLYFVQAGAYTQAMKILTGVEYDWRFIVVETGGETDQPLVAVYTLEYNSEELVAGRLMFKRACEKILEYQKHGFEGYSNFAEPINMPRYFIEREFALHEEIEL